MEKRSRTPLLLMELALALLIFAFCAGCCLRLFAAARAMAEESRALGQAASAAQTAAECWKKTGGDLEETARLLLAEAGEGSLTMPCAEDGTLTLTDAGGRVAEIVVTDGAGERFALRVKAVRDGK